MRKIITEGFFLFVVCVSVAIAQPIEKDLTIPTTVAEETSDKKLSWPDAQFGPFKFHDKQLVATAKYIHGIFTVEGSNGEVLYADEYDEDYLLSNVYKIVGNSGEGLLIVGDRGPNAPPCGPEFKVIGFKGGKIKELSKNIIMCGYIVDKPIPKENNTIILKEHDILTAAFTDSNYFVNVPFKVDFNNATFLPEKNIGEFSVDYNKEQDMLKEFGIPALNLYSSSDTSSPKSNTRLIDVKTFEVLGVYASVKMQDAGRRQSEIVISDKAIKVRVNGKIYWLDGKDKAYLHRLGVGVFD